MNNEIETSKNKKLEKGFEFSGILIKFLLLISIFSVGYFWGYKFNQFNSVFEINSQKGEKSLGDEDMDLFFEVVDLIEKNHIEKNIDYKELRDGSIKGLVSALGDDYSQYYNVEEYEDVEDGQAGVFEGIGVTLRYNGDYTFIESPIDGFPGEKAGLMAGDIITKVDNEDMKRKNTRFVASKILGEAGTDVEIEVFRSRDGKTYQKNITREVIDLDNIEYEVVGDGIVKIKILKFTESSLIQFKSDWDNVITKVSSENPKAIILDLRNNSGGFVDAAIHVLSEFFPKQTLVMSEVDREENKLDKYTKREGEFENLPVVVLINNGSASASEIVTGAFQDHSRAKIIGEETVGKGVEQYVLNLSDGSSLFLVAKKWLTPNGNNVNSSNPIQPDIYIEKTTEDFENGIDPQLDKAIEILSS